MGPIVGNIMATIMVSHIPIKSGALISFGMRVPTWPRPVTMLDISRACRTVSAQAMAAKPSRTPTVARVTQVSNRDIAERGVSRSLAAFTGANSLMGPLSRLRRSLSITSRQ